MAAFSVFHPLSPSFLHYQKLMNTKLGRNNALSLYQIQRIPSDNHIRARLDGLQPTVLEAAFDIAPDVLLQHLDACRNFLIFADRTLIAVDGTQFYSSYKIKCDQCTTKNHKATSTRYHHNALVAVLVAPKHKQILPLEVEFITPQDCENKTVKRLLRKRAGEFDRSFQAGRPRR